MSKNKKKKKKTLKDLITVFVDFWPGKFWTEVGGTVVEHKLISEARTWAWEQHGCRIVLDWSRKFPIRKKKVKTK